VAFDVTVLLSVRCSAFVCESFLVPLASSRFQYPTRSVSSTPAAAATSHVIVAVPTRPLGPVAEIVAVPLDSTVGVPVNCPVEALHVTPVGSPLAEYVDTRPE
jgi:hypothetical protein